jgi:hypothetical protein
MGEKVMATIGTSFYHFINHVDHPDTQVFCADSPSQESVDRLLNRFTDAKFVSTSFTNTIIEIWFNREVSVSVGALYAHNMLVGGGAFQYITRLFPDNDPNSGSPPVKVFPLEDPRKFYLSEDPWFQSNQIDTLTQPTIAYQYDVTPTSIGYLPNNYTCRSATIQILSAQPFVLEAGMLWFSGLTYTDTRYTFVGIEDGINVISPGMPDRAAGAGVSSLAIDPLREMILDFPVIHRDDIVAWSTMYHRVRNDNPFIFFRVPQAFSTPPDRSTDGGILRFLSPKFTTKNHVGNDWETTDQFSLKLSMTHWL